MITGRTQTALGVPVLFLGLSGENVTRLAAGEPIRVPVSRMSHLDLPPVEVWIAYGKTEEALIDLIRDHVKTITER